jgi:hypothetical protein
MLHTRSSFLVTMMRISNWILEAWLLIGVIVVLTGYHGREVGRHSTPEREELNSGAQQGVNESGRPGYSGPWPGPGQAHRYIFKFCALDIKLLPRSTASATYVEEAMKGHILGQAQMTAMYSRPSPAPPK